MEFKFNVNDVFKHPVIVITNTLVPPGFSGDKRALWDAQSKVSQVVNAMGEASATAQGLTKPITTAERLRNSEHRLYLLIDQTANGGKGAVTGMLKTGEKGLYVFDREGQHYQVSPGCVLDFYVHESRQRTGLGKRLFQHMLETEKTEPVKMAIDRPSEKFLGFLNKYYDLNTPVKQMNNFVVFDGFFQRSPEPINTVEVDTSSASRPPSKKESANGLQHFSSPYGRYGAPRPPCSMGQIIHNDTSVVNKGLHEASGVKSAPATNLGSQIGSEKISADGSAKLDRPRSLFIQLDETTEEKCAKDATKALEVSDDAVHDIENELEKIDDSVDDIQKAVEKIHIDVENAQKKMQESTPEESASKSGKHTPSHLTGQGFFDLKFYHNKLW